MIRVQEADFDVGGELARLTTDGTEAGGVCAFIGLVRDFAGPDALDVLEIEHYPRMTTRALKRIEAAAQARWPGVETLVIHRVGRLTPGERIVLVAAAATHREEAFAACRFLIDVLKTQAPFWKAEVGTHGRRWVEARADDEEAAARWLLPGADAGGDR